MEQISSDLKKLNCHYVQQAYLRNFSADQDSKKIWQLSINQGKETGNAILRPIKKVASENNFYPTWLEDWLNNYVENNGIKALNKLVTIKNFYHLNDEEKRNIVEWIMIQYIRTPSTQEKLFKQFKDMIKSKMDVFLNELPINEQNCFKSSLSEYILNKEDELKQNLWDFISNKWRYNYSILKTHNFHVCENKTSQKIFTSDNPICIYSDLDKEERFVCKIDFYYENSVSFVEDLSVEIPSRMYYIVALNPKVLLWIKPKKYDRYSHPGYKILNEDTEIRSYNKLLIKNCGNYIFSNSNSFRTINNLLITNPKLRDHLKKDIKIGPLNYSIKKGKKTKRELAVDKIKTKFNFNSEELSKLTIIHRKSLLEAIGQLQAIPEINFTNEFLTEISKLENDQIIEKIILKIRDLPFKSHFKMIKIFEKYPELLNSLINFFKNDNKNEYSVNK